MWPPPEEGRIPITPDDNATGWATELLQRIPEATVKEQRNHITATIGGKVFAYTRGSNLIVKLPKERVDELERSGATARLVMGAKQMAEWAVISHPAGDDGASGLLREAADFVSPAR